MPAPAPVITDLARQIADATAAGRPADPDVLAAYRDATAPKPTLLQRNFRCEPALWARVEHAATDDVSASEIIRRALDAYLPA